MPPRPTSPALASAAGAVARPFAGLAFAWVSMAVVVAGPGCARVVESRSLRVVPLERPRQITEERGVGFGVRGERDGGLLRVRVEEVRRCATVTLQRADGFERTERVAQGGTLAIQWTMGGLFTLAGAGIIGWNAASPARADASGAVPVGNSTSAILQGSLIGGVGVGLLVASLVQQLSLGRSDKPLGSRELRRDGPTRTCSHGPAASGTVRLTLPDGTSLQATVDAAGKAELPLPADLDERLRDTDRRATLEVLGDWRSQTRVSL